MLLSESTIIDRVSIFSKGTAPGLCLLGAVQRVTRPLQTDRPDGLAGWLADTEHMSLRHYYGMSPRESGLVLAVAG